MDCTITSFRNTRRLQHAEKILSETDKKIIDIAFENGFSNASYFTENFTKYAGYEKAYSRAYDRLKHRKRAGTIDTKTWNKLVVEIQDIRDDARAGKISDAEAVEKLNEY